MCTMWMVTSPVTLLLCAQALFESYVFYHEAVQLVKENELTCVTMYLDMTLPLLQIFVVFIAQVAVFWFFMASILATFNFATVNYAFWLVAFLAMQMTMIFCRGEDSVLGFAFPVHEVYRLWVKCGPGMSGSMMLSWPDSPKEKTALIEVTKAALIFRGVLGFFCNAILREIMAYTIPLMLMSFSEPMDFVVYCVGVNFICTVDDMKDKRFIMNSQGDV